MSPPELALLYLRAMRKRMVKRERVSAGWREDGESHYWDSVRSGETLLGQCLSSGQCLSGRSGQSGTVKTEVQQRLVHSRLSQEQCPTGCPKNSVPRVVPLTLSVSVFFGGQCQRRENGTERRAAQLERPGNDILRANDQRHFVCQFRDSHVTAGIYGAAFFLGILMSLF